MAKQGTSLSKIIFLTLCFVYILPLVVFFYILPAASSQLNEGSQFTSSILSGPISHCPQCPTCEIFNNKQVSAATSDLRAPDNESDVLSQQVENLRDELKTVIQMLKEQNVELTENKSAIQQLDSRISSEAISVEGRNPYWCGTVDLNPARYALEPCRSQTGQEIALYDKYFSNLCGGTFIELGAHNGCDFSNTNVYEQALHWNGILIEPNSYTFAELVKNRPNAYTVNAVISNEKRNGTFYSDSGDRALFGSVVGSHERAEAVKYIPLHEIIEAAKYSVIDLLSLDVEGHECQVLEGIEWDRVDIRVILVEVNKADIAGCVARILESKGYVKDGKIAEMKEILFDAVYVKRDIDWL